MAANWSAETVVAHDVVGRLMLNAARQPGLAQVYDALLGFQVCAAAKSSLSLARWVPSATRAPSDEGAL
jgi:hypothetical protein